MWYVKFTRLITPKGMAAAGALPTVGDTQFIGPWGYAEATRRLKTVLQDSNAINPTLTCEEPEIETK